MTNIEKKLLEAGWFPGRKIDIKDMEEHLIGRGYEIFPAARSFLEEFGMLYIAIENAKIFTERYKVHYTDVKRAISYSHSYEAISGLEKIASERLIPVGMANNEYQYLFVSESGKIYVDNVKLGDSFMEACEKLFSPK